MFSATCSPMLSSALRRVLQKLFSCTTAPLGYLYSVQDAGAKKKKEKKSGLRSEETSARRQQNHQNSRWYL